MVVVTHRVPQEWVNREGSPFTFVTEGVAKAIDVAREIAGDQDVVVGAPSVTQQCLQLGLLDAIHIDLAPVVLGRGIRLFDHLTKRVEFLVTEASGNPRSRTSPTGSSNSCESPGSPRKEEGRARTRRPHPRHQPKRPPAKLARRSRRNAMICPLLTYADMQKAMAESPRYSTADRPAQRRRCRDPLERRGSRGADGSAGGPARQPRRPWLDLRTNRHPDAHYSTTLSRGGHVLNDHIQQPTARSAGTAPRSRGQHLDLRNARVRQLTRSSP